ncbi:MAG: hypothetical protein MJZ41_11715 [Bacteroidaceae bacterium]|nr:hypothetical protein [Bacteroidaceae bacterium]
MVKRLLSFICICVLLASCTGSHTHLFHDADSTAVVKSHLEQSLSIKEENNDSALVLLLNAVDYCNGCEPALRYEAYKNISEMYEQKNLYEPQQKFQLLMEEVARELDDKQKEADACLRISMTYMVMGSLDDALLNAKKAYRLSLADSSDFKANCLLMQTQVFLQKEMTDSAKFYLTEAQKTCPHIRKSEMYRLSDAYILLALEQYENLEKKTDEYKHDGSVFLNAELTRLQMSLHEDTENWHKAYDDAQALIMLSDSISRMEASKSMAHIHELQHEQQMQRNRAEREAERSSLYIIIIVILALLLTSCVLVLIFRKKAIIAHNHELEAMRLADESQANEAITKEENIQLQKLYYEHLYAIILPILNANRGKTGHINLEESSWKLIEENTEMVLPNFTSKLRRYHPSLSNEDVRFCCMIMMRVPNAVLADVYGIATSSVAIRKQRMKKKLDADIHEQTIENYLGQYII